VSHQRLVLGYLFENLLSGLLTQQLSGLEQTSTRFPSGAPSLPCFRLMLWYLEWTCSLQFCRQWAPPSPPLLTPTVQALWSSPRPK
jgi:hypothetical protein